MVDKKFTEEYIKVTDLDVDRTVQRSFLDMRKIERFVAKFNPAALGAITVSRRNPVTNIVLDGMHRVEVVRRVTTSTGEMLAHVFDGLSREEEAQLFLDLNAGNQPNLLDRFKARIVAGDPVARSIDDVVHSYGWRWGNNADKGLVACVGTVERIYRLGQSTETYPDLLSDTFMVVTHAWGDQTEATMASVLDGISAVLLEYGEMIDTQRLSDRLGRYSGGPHALLEDGRTLSRSVRGRLAMGVATRIVDDYNVGLKTRKLYTWRKHR